MEMSIIVDYTVSPVSQYMTVIPTLPYIAVVCCNLHSLALKTARKIRRYCWFAVTIEQLSQICIFPLMNSAHIQRTQIKGVWCNHAAAYSSLINMHHLHSSPDARTTLAFCLIICHPLLSATVTSALLRSVTIYGWKRERCWLTRRASGGSELFKTLAARWFVNIHLWTDQQICKANEGICQLAQSVTLQSALKIDFIMLKESQLRESHCQVLILWSNQSPNSSQQKGRNYCIKFKSAYEFVTVVIN